MPDDRLFHIVVDQVREDTTLLPGNAGLQQVHVVPFMVDSGPAKGHTGEVRVAPADFTPATVDRLIRDRITNLHGLAGLGGADAGMA